jgi:hypothetical protein
MCQALVANGKKQKSIGFIHSASRSCHNELLAFKGSDSRVTRHFNTPTYECDQKIKITARSIEVTRGIYIVSGFPCGAAGAVEASFPRIVNYVFVYF